MAVGPAIPVYKIVPYIYYEDACDVPTQFCVAPTLDQLDRKASLLVMLDSSYN